MNGIIGEKGGRGGGWGVGGGGGIEICLESQRIANVRAQTQGVEAQTEAFVETRQFIIRK